MIMWLEAWANTFSSNVFWLLLPLTALCVYICIGATGDIARFAFGSSEYSDAIWRRLAAAQGIIIAWIVWGIIAAVPAPNYQIKEVPKIQYVTAASKYNEFYDHCWEVLHGHAHDVGDSDADKTCHDRAMLQTIPGFHIVYRTGPATTVVKYQDRIVTRFAPDPYIKLYAACMGDFAGKSSEVWSVDDSKGSIERDNRIKMCHENAMSVRVSMGVK